MRALQSLRRFLGPIAGASRYLLRLPPPPSDLNDVVLTTGYPADRNACHGMLVPETGSIIIHVTVIKVFRNMYSINKSVLSNVA